MSDETPGARALDPARYAALEVARAYGLPETAQLRLATLAELVTDDAHAPTTIRDPRGIAADHLADSLVALELDAVRSARVIADIGSGAGFPGLPLAIALPDACVALVEASARKCAFMARAIAACGIANARAVHARAEEWKEGLGLHDVVTGRAIAPLAVLAEYAAPLLRLGGTVIAWRGRRDSEEERRAVLAATELGLQMQAPIPVRPYEDAHDRHLHLMLKVMETPDRFPRRPGVARKRPLGGRPVPSDRARR